MSSGREGGRRAIEKSEHQKLLYRTTAVAYGRCFTVYMQFYQYSSNVNLSQNWTTRLKPRFSSLTQHQWHIQTSNLAVITRSSYLIISTENQPFQNHLPNSKYCWRIIFQRTTNLFRIWWHRFRIYYQSNHTSLP